MPETFSQNLGEGFALSRMTLVLCIPSQNGFTGTLWQTPEHASATAHEREKGLPLFLCE